MALKHTPLCDFGLAAPDFSLPGTDGNDWSRDRCAGENGLLVMFISNHCPYVQAIRAKLVRDCRELAEHGIGSVAIMPNDVVRYPADNMDNMRRVAEEFEFPFPYLLDESQDVARAYGAVCTPDFFGYNAELGLQYRGRLDESRKEAIENARRDLFEAMKQVAETGNGPEDHIPSMGCSIKWIGESE